MSVSKPCNYALFHWRLNNNEIEGLRYFTVLAYKDARNIHSQVGRPQHLGRYNNVNKHICITKHF